MAVKIYRPLVTSMDDLASSPHPVLTSNGTSVYRYFSESVPGSPQARIYTDKMLKSPFRYTTEKEALIGLINGMKASPVAEDVCVHLKVLQRPRLSKHF